MIKKLNVGDHIVFRCTKMEVSTTGKYPDYIFDTDRGESYSAPKGAIDRQLQKLGLTVEGCVGNWFRLERAPNKEDASRSWWNLHIDAESGSAAPAPSKRIAGPSSVPGEAPERYKDASGTKSPGVGQAEPQTIHTGGVTLDDIASAYKWAWGMAEKVQGQDNTPMERQATQAGAATLLIALQKEGLVRGFAQRSFDKAVRKTFDLPHPESEEFDDPTQIPF